MRRPYPGSYPAAGSIIPHPVPLSSRFPANHARAGLRMPRLPTLPRPRVFRTISPPPGLMTNGSDPPAARDPWPVACAPVSRSSRPRLSSAFRPPAPSRPLRTGLADFNPPFRDNDERALEPSAYIPTPLVRFHAPTRRPAAPAPLPARRKPASEPLNFYLRAGPNPLTPRISSIDGWVADRYHFGIGDRIIG